MASPGEEEEDAIKWCSAALYLGGADTVSRLVSTTPPSVTDASWQIVSVMTSFFYLMATYPDVQKQAQAEIENVTGTDRLPTLDDQASMPFVGALVKEIIRWGPVAPLGDHDTSSSF